LYFNQTPYAKLDFIKNIQDGGNNVLMVGDGLNDAGALKQSFVGISIAEDSNVFSPACDGILESGNFDLLPKLIQFSKSSMRIIVVSFIISFLYNIAGLAFAIQGTLSPLIAAILMPLSSISVVVFTTGATRLLARLQLQ
jgi:Cu+-exporting ATPase